MRQDKREKRLVLGEVNGQQRTGVVIPVCAFVFAAPTALALLHCGEHVF